jgi:hypothetical protein
MNQKEKLLIYLICIFIISSLVLFLLEKKYIYFFTFITFLVSIPLFLKYKNDFIILIPMINAIADVTIDFFPEEGMLNSGMIRAFIIIVFIMVYLSRQKKLYRYNIYIYIFSVYLILLCLKSSDFKISFFLSLKVITALLMFPIAYTYFKDFNKFRKLHNIIILSLVIMFLNYLFAQIFKIGGSFYIDDSFYGGGGGIGVPITISMILLTIPNILKYSKSKIKRIIIGISYFSSLLVLILIFKRSSIAAVIIGHLLYLFFIKERIRMVKYLIILMIIITALFTVGETIFYKTKFSKKLEIRTSENQRLEKQSRYIYTKFVISEFLTKGIDHSLFGTELFNSVNYLRRLSITERSLHTDYNTLLHGSGIIGIVLYILIFIKIIRLIENTKYNQKYPNTTKEFRATSYSLLAGFMVNSLSGVFYVISPTSFMFIYLGALLGLSKKMKAENRYSNINKLKSNQFNKHNIV